MKNRLKKTGFTIIEVVLVLAIAGLIFLMVFVALPSLQKSQKDTQRRSDMARVSTAMTQYLTNNRKLPKKGSGSSFIDGYLDGSNFKDPDGGAYKIDFEEWGESGPGALSDPTYGWATNDYKTASMKYNIMVYTKAKCDGDHASNSGAGKNDYAVTYKLEGSGYYCIGS